MINHELIHIGQEVEDALAQRKPVVALESNFITEGIPYPENFATARLVEQIIRDQGAVPAIIAICQGKIHIGITEEILEQLAQKNIRNVSCRDLAYALTHRITASTTVSATMFCAHLVNLPIFVTGGIGGSNDYHGENYHISSDLIELSQIPIAIICSGTKSILDLSKTLEMLETHGVPIIGYKTNEFPALYTHSKGIPIKHRSDDVSEIAAIMQVHQKLHLKNGIIIANPIPKSAEIPDEQMLPIIKQAQSETHTINGQVITPSVLKRIAELTTGQSLRANIELIKANAELGAQIASAYFQ